MAETKAQTQAKFGKDKILAFRLLDDRSTKDGAKLALQTSHSWSYDRKAEVTQTKDGPVVTSGGLEVSLDLSAVTSNDELNRMLKDSVVNGKKLEVWEIDLASKKPTENKYKAIYAQGNLEKWSVPSDVNGLEELSTTMKIDGVPQEGELTLTQEQVSAIQYAFADLKKTVV